MHTRPDSVCTLDTVCMLWCGGMTGWMASTLKKCGSCPVRQHVLKVLLTQKSLQHGDTHRVT